MTFPNFVCLHKDSVYDHYRYFRVYIILGKRNHLSIARKSAFDTSKMKKMETILNMVGLIILLAIFTYLFGYPSLGKFMSRALQVNKKEITLTRAESPAFTFCPMNPLIAGAGWRTYFDIYETLDVLSEICGNATDAYACIDENTFNVNDMIYEGALMEVQKDDSPWAPVVDFTNETLWKRVFTLSFYGFCYSIQPNMDYSSYRPYFAFNDLLNLTYAIYIHDPAYFMLAISPLTVPRAYLQLLDIGTHTEINIKTSLIKKYKDGTCNNDENYVFQDCIDSKVIETIGCR